MENYNWEQKLFKYEFCRGIINNSTIVCNNYDTIKYYGNKEQFLSWEKRASGVLPDQDTD